MKIHYYAAARAAAGVAHEDVAPAQLKKTDSICLGDLINYLSCTHTGRTASGMPFKKVLAQCSFLVNGESATALAPLSELDRIDVLPPFAGG